MTLTNHLLSGAALAKFLPLPVAIPLAFLSHFVLDASPHFGFKDMEATKQHWGVWKSVTVLDAIMGIVVSSWLVSSGHYVWLLVGLVAYSPDVAWIYRFIVQEKFGKLAPTKGNRLTEFHSGIQKYQRAWGGIVEVLYAAGMFLIVR